MQNHAKRKLGMFLATQHFLNANAGVAETLPRYTGYRKEFDLAVDQMRHHYEVVQDYPFGLNVGKKELRNLLISLVADQSRKICALATTDGDIKARNLAYHSVSALKITSDVELCETATRMLHLAETQLSSLADFGINPQSQQKLAETIQSYQTLLANIELSAIQRKQLAALFQKAQKDADAMLLQIDSLVEITRSSDPQFYIGYHLSRKMVKSNTGRRTSSKLTSNGTAPVSPSSTSGV